MPSLRSTHHRHHHPFPIIYRVQTPPYASRRYTPVTSCNDRFLYEKVHGTSAVSRTPSEDNDLSSDRHGTATANAINPQIIKIHSQSNPNPNPHPIRYPVPGQNMQKSIEFHGSRLRDGTNMAILQLLPWFLSPVSPGNQAVCDVPDAGAAVPLQRASEQARPAHLCDHASVKCAVSVVDDHSGRQNLLRKFLGRPLIFSHFPEKK